MVVCGVALVSAREVNFSSFSLAAGMMSNAAFALYAIRAKVLLKTREPVSTYALLTALSCAVLTPVALVMEWSGAGASRLAAAKRLRRRHVRGVACASLACAQVSLVLINVHHEPVPVDLAPRRRLPGRARVQRGRVGVDGRATARR